ncbi:hypothetical protein RRG08_007409 [Elysia crispata]|uniref:Uncharacterized protein n=1 Tax=Elysia crispata TaxID=231223 RepID=A0AAE1AAF6_9GAST|nr:hypothetical protein RRG08_007409 [Elysia crispata]
MSSTHTHTHTLPFSSPMGSRDRSLSHRQSAERAVHLNRVDIFLAVKCPPPTPTPTHTSFLQPYGKPRQILISQTVSRTGRPPKSCRYIPCSQMSSTHTHPHTSFLQPYGKPRQILISQTVSRTGRPPKSCRYIPCSQMSSTHPPTHFLSPALWEAETDPYLTDSQQNGPST